jgi:hypothetical protein
MGNRQMEQANNIEALQQNLKIPQVARANAQEI